METKFSHEGSKAQRNTRRINGLEKYKPFYEFLRALVSLWHKWFPLVRLGIYREENHISRGGLPGPALADHRQG
jgi:hypothetical protein